MEVCYINGEYKAFCDYDSHQNPSATTESYGPSHTRHQIRFDLAYATVKSADKRPQLWFSGYKDPACWCPYGKGPAAHWVYLSSSFFLG